MDAERNWVSPELEQISNSLIPQDLLPNYLCEFIDHVTRCVESNSYLTDFLKRAQNESFETFERSVSDEADDVIPNVVIYAIVLENLTSAMLNDWKIIEVCEIIWARERKTKSRLGHHLGVWSAMFVIKLSSVENAINRFIKFEKKGTLPWKFGRFFVSINILEAAAAELANRFRYNAATGKILADHRPGHRYHNKTTQAGPTVWSDDGKLVLFQMPYPRLWADLYTTWNLAFVNQLVDAPFAMTKLLIPAVNDYAHNPPSYIHRRAMALYIQLHFVGFRSWDYDLQGKKRIDWRDRKLTNYWGKVNYENALKYNQLASLPADDNETRLPPEE